MFHTDGRMKKEREACDRTLSCPQTLRKSCIWFIHASNQTQFHAPHPITITPQESDDDLTIENYDMTIQTVTKQWNAVWVVMCQKVIQE